VREARTIRLEAAPRVRFVAPGPLPDGVVRLGVRLVRDSFGKPAQRHRPIAWLGESGEVELSAPALGTLRVEAWILRKPGPFEVENQPPQQVEVSAGAQAAPFELVLQPEALARALAKVGG
jgi:hypothetical protein